MSQRVVRQAAAVLAIVLSFVSGVQPARPAGSVSERPLDPTAAPSSTPPVSVETPAPEAPEIPDFFDVEAGQGPPALALIPAELVEAMRIETVWPCGGSMTVCLSIEDDALILTRISLGENPSSLNDRIYVMWNIRLRAALGYKEILPGWKRPLDRWGPETAIATEALCDRGCQYSPARLAADVEYPCAIEPSNSLRLMLCPTDEQAGEFYLTWQAAEWVLAQPMSAFPMELRGYDGFRSPQVLWLGRHYRDGGLPSAQFFAGGNVYTDEYVEDNVYWDELEAAR